MAPAFSIAEAEVGDGCLTAAFSRSCVYLTDLRKSSDSILGRANAVDHAFKMSAGGSEQAFHPTWKCREGFVY